MSDKLNAFFKAEHSRLMTDMFLLLKDLVPKVRAAPPALGMVAPTDQQMTDFGNFTGNVNYWPDHQAEFVPVGYKRDGANFVPEGSAPGTLPDSYPQQMQIAITATGERRSGQGAPYLDPRGITVVPIIVAKAGNLAVQIAEFGSSPSYKSFTISAKPGDLQAFLATSSNGTNVGASVDVAPGTYYVNLVFWIYASNQPSTDAAAQGVILSANLP